MGSIKMVCFLLNSLWGQYSVQSQHFVRQQKLVSRQYPLLRTIQL